MLKDLLLNLLNQLRLLPSQKSLKLLRLPKKRRNKNLKLKKENQKKRDGNAGEEGITDQDLMENKEVPDLGQDTRKRR